MPRLTKPVSADLAEHADVLRARRALAELDTLRFVQAALREGFSQAQIAGALQLSQATVSRMAARAVEGPTVAEIIDRATAKEIDRTEMVRRLRSLKINLRSRGSSQTSWAAVRLAVRDQRLSRQEAEALAVEIAERTAHGVVRSMELEAQPVPEAGVNRMVDKVKARLAADLD